MIFIDSNVLVAYEVKEDSNHERAVNLIDRIAKGEFDTLFTSDYIFDETITVTLVKSKSLEKAILVGQYIMNSTEILKVDVESFENAWQSFKNQKNTKLSFTDCTNISLMKDRGIHNLATFDREFKKIESINVVG